MTVKYIESKHKNHKHKGWFYDHITKAFYRWNDFIKVVKQHGNS
jgi:hypothetical protein